MLAPHPSRPWRILLAPNSFKGGATATEALRVFEEGAIQFSRITNQPIELVHSPICDGGTGFAELVGRKSAPETRLITVDFLDPRLRPRRGSLPVRSDGVAVAESAEFIGLVLVPPKDRNPLASSSYGLGQAIRAAAESQVRRILVGCGDSATSDCGIGMMAALGVRFFDELGDAIDYPVASDLPRIHQADIDPAVEILASLEVELACNLSSIAGGKSSTARIYALQKGATPEQAEELWNGYRSFISIIEQRVGMPGLGLTPGSGAAGGIGFGLMAVATRFQARYSFEVTFAEIGLEDNLAQVDLMVTSEGLFDHSSVKGKAPVAAALYAKRFGVPTIAIVGGIMQGAISKQLRSGFDLIQPLSGVPLSVEWYIENFDVAGREAVVRALLSFYHRQREL